MSTITELYESVMASTEGAEKTAAAVTEDDGPDFNAEFFEKIADGEEAETQALHEFIENARSEGHSDEDIEAALEDAMKAAGIEDDGEGDGEPVSEADGDGQGGDGDGEPGAEDDFEHAKAAAWSEGATKAIMDVLESDMAKEAGVTVDDLIDFDLGGVYAEGYAQTRGEAEEVVQKIAAHKKEAKGSGLAKKLMESIGKGKNQIRGAAKNPKSLKKGVQKAMREGGGGAKGAANVGKKYAPALAVGGAGAAGLGGAGLTAKKLMSKKDKKD